MAASSTASSSGPRYAPPDPSLPKPWKGLVDVATGNLYFWNPVTNVTQYERPTSTDSPPESSVVSKSSSAQPDKHGPGKETETNPSAQTDEHSHGKETEPNPSAQTDEHSHGKETEPNPSAQTDEHGIGKDTGKYISAQLDGHGTRKETEIHSRACEDGVKQETVSGINQMLRAGSDYCTSSQIGTINTGPGSSSSREHAPSTGAPCLSVEAYRCKHEITLMGTNVPQPFMSFESTGFPPPILRVLHNAGFSAPTPIQAQSWPIALQGRNIVAVAKTGSGKTLGYLIPGFATIKRCSNNPMMGPTVLILSPTRELATQIQDEAVKFGQSIGISCACLYGGAQKGPQLRELENGVHIVVATPGRLNDVIEMKKINLQQVSYLVLDEADRMLDMGFEPQIRKIVNGVPAKRQTLMFTATWPKEVRKIASDLLGNSNPVQVNIGNVDELVANKSITQHVEVMAPMEKHRRLETILRSQEPGSKVIIFCSTKRMCDQLASNLTRQFGAASIHGDKSQNERDHVLNQFRTGKSPVLVATDVAARGLDIKDIRVVVNYDFPTGVEDYVHRIGRTGRAGATGVAYTFFGDRDAKYASDLIKILEGANQRVPPEIRGMASQGSGMGSFRRWSGGSDSGFGSSGGRGSQRASTFPSGRQGADGGRGYGNESLQRERSRSPTGWAGNSKNWSSARSSSPDRYNGSAGNDGSGGKSFHELMMGRGRS